MPQKPPNQDPKEWPVDEDDLDALADAALAEPSYEAIERFMRGGSCPDEGFAKSLRDARERSQRLAAEVPNARDILSARRKKTFLRALAHGGNVAMACAAAGWSRNIPYSIRKADKDFADKWAFAMENAADLLEAEAYRRAVHGVEKDVWHKTKDAATVVGQETVYSDSLMTLLLKGAKPDKYRERQEVQHEGSKGGVLIVPGILDPKAWEAGASAQQAKYREKQEIE